MTRVNVLLPQVLTDQHLDEEWYELPRAFAAVYILINAGVSADRYNVYNTYRAGKGHLRFFYTRCRWLKFRHMALYDELIKRRQWPDDKEALKIWAHASEIPTPWYGNWQVTPQAAERNLRRLCELDDVYLPLKKRSAITLAWRGGDR